MRRWIICSLLPVRCLNCTTIRTASALTDQRSNSSSGKLIVVGIAHTTVGRSQRRYRIHCVIINHTKVREEMAAICCSIDSVTSQELIRNTTPYDQVQSTSVQKFQPLASDLSCALALTPKRS